MTKRQMKGWKVLAIDGVDQLALLELRDGKFWDGEPATRREDGTTPMPDGFYFVELDGGRILKDILYGPYASAVEAEIAARKTPTIADVNRAVTELVRKGRQSPGENVTERVCRLRDGRAVKTEEDCRQWYYEYLDDISQTWGQDHTPHEAFPTMIRVMVEWIEVTHGHSAEGDLENVRALADAVSDLTGCLRKCLASTAVQHE